MPILLWILLLTLVLSTHPAQKHKYSPQELSEALSKEESVYKLSFEEAFKLYGKGQNRQEMLQRFQNIDVNGNGFLDDHEFEAAFSALKEELHEVNYMYEQAEYDRKMKQEMKQEL